MNNIKTRVSSVNQALFVGPAPCTGYHFIDISGKLNNDYTENLNNNNLVQYIDRLISINYALSPSRQEYKQIGQKGLFSRQNSAIPTIDLDISYYVVGVKNELRLGLNCNYARFDYPNSGNPNYVSKVCPISGFLDRNTTQPTGEPYWPCNYTDKRNLFLITTKQNDEANKNKIAEDRNTLRYSVVPEALEFEVTNFGNCYLMSYATNGAVGQAPVAKAVFSCENLSFNISGSGINIPAVSPRTREEYDNIYYNIPQIVDDNSPAILNPGDIRINIKTEDNQVIEGMGVNFNDVALESYSIDFSLSRNELNSIGYKLPLDKEVISPVMVNFNVSLIVQDTTSGNIVNLLDKDSNYNVSIKLKNPITYSTIRNTAGETAVQYDFINAKFDQINWSSSIGQTKTANMSFSTEIDIDDFSKGLFISGLLNVDKIGDYLIFDDDDNLCTNYLTWDDESYALLNLKPVY